MEISSTQHQLFSVPVWEFDLSEAIGDLADELVAAARAAVTELPARGLPFRQSLPQLGQRSEAWADALSLFGDVAQHVLDHYYQRRNYQVTDISAWALEVDGGDAWDLEGRRFGLMHNHANSTLSSVLYLDLPPDEPNPHGGTVFQDPLAHVTRESAGTGVVTVAATNLHLVIFPSWLEHGPARPLAAKLSPPRLTVAADYRTDSVPNPR